MSSFRFLKEIGPGFWNLRGSLKMVGGFVDIGTHMSFARLSSGKIVVIDTCKFSDDVKAEIDLLTENGALMEAVVATHPYHTIAFSFFHDIYPNVKYYGTPRHIKTITGIPWSGDVSTEFVQNLWEPEISMRIPAGAEFVDPAPNNHFSNVFILHKQSKTIHNDDTILYIETPNIILRYIGGFKPGILRFHHSLENGIGLYPTAEAPQQFKEWLESLMRDWDFDNICSAHNGIKFGNAKEALRLTLEKAEITLAMLAEKANKK